MSYSYKSKAEPCSVSGTKHKWEFVRNGTVSSGSSGFGGGSIRVSLRGLYKCECGKTRIGKANYSAPDADVRNHIPGA